MHFTISNLTWLCCDFIITSVLWNHEVGRKKLVWSHLLLVSKSKNVQVKESKTRWNTIDEIQEYRPWNKHPKLICRLANEPTLNNYFPIRFFIFIFINHYLILKSSVKQNWLSRHSTTPHPLWISFALMSSYESPPI